MLLLLELLYNLGRRKASILSIAGLYRWVEGELCGSMSSLFYLPVIPEAIMISALGSRKNTSILVGKWPLFFSSLRTCFQLSVPPPLFDPKFAVWHNRGLKPVTPQATIYTYKFPLNSLLPSMFVSLVFMYIRPCYAWLNWLCYLLVMNCQKLCIIAIQQRLRGVGTWTVLRDELESMAHAQLLSMSRSPSTCGGPNMIFRYRPQLNSRSSDPLCLLDGGWLPEDGLVTVESDFWFA